MLIGLLCTMMTVGMMTPALVSRLGEDAPRKLILVTTGTLVMLASVPVIFAPPSQGAVNLQSIVRLPVINRADMLNDFEVGARVLLVGTLVDNAALDDFGLVAYRQIDTTEADTPTVDFNFPPLQLDVDGVTVTLDYAPASATGTDAALYGWSIAQDDGTTRYGYRNGDTLVLVADMTDDGYQPVWMVPGTDAEALYATVEPFSIVGNLLGVFGLLVGVNIMTYGWRRA
jgi:hypothetical protein